MIGRNILMLFSPKFQDFGCDIGREYLQRTGSGKVHGICTGSKDVLNYVQKNLGSHAGFFWHINTEEEKWISEKKPSINFLARIEYELGDGLYGRIITSDRRIGRGFVRGGITRPDKFGNEAIEDPMNVPQKYVNGLYLFLNHVLTKTKPDHVFCYAVAGAPALLLAEMCKARKISFSRLTTLRLGNRKVVDRDPKGKLSCVSKRFQDVLQMKHQFVEERKIAQKLLKEFRARPTPPEYMQQNKFRARNHNLFISTIKAMKATARILARFIQSGKLDRESINRSWFKVLINLKRVLISKKIFANRVPDDIPFIYYPLHVEPEASTMVLSPWHTDQVSIIEALAKSAPADMCIVVKEHLPMLGKRPQGFYQTIARIPRVILIGPEHNGMSLIQKSGLVVVITGTAAWEAIRLKKPTLVIGDSPFLAIDEGVVFEPCLSNLHKSIPRAIKKPAATDDTLECYIAAGLAESFEMPSSLLWGNYKAHSDKIKKDVVCNIVNKLIKN